MDIANIEPLNSAEIAELAGGTVLLTTSPVQWAYAAAWPGSSDPSHEAIASITMEVSAGAIGIIALGADGRASADNEIVVKAGDGRRTLDVLLRPPSNAKLCLRNVAAGQISRCRVFGYETCIRQSLNVDPAFEQLIRDILIDPAKAKSAVATKFGVRAKSIGTLNSDRDHINLVIDEIFFDELGRFLIDEYRRSCDLLPTYDQSKMDGFSGYLGRDYFNSYFRQSITRVYHLVTMLRDFDMRGGTVLEVGSLFGTFAGPLQRLGYKVTAVDRYQKFRGSLDGYIKDLQSCGVSVVATGVDDEEAAISQLGQFDAVISMAVIEHIPHTPREFLLALAARVRSGGLLVIDTPNITMYWHRRRLQAGHSIHQSIEKQFYSPIPFEGHHREYTAAEVRWMLEQVGCIDVRCELFDYNLFQFDVLSREHIVAMLAMVSDPTLTDTILAAGRVARSV